MKQPDRPFKRWLVPIGVLVVGLWAAPAMAQFIATTVPTLSEWGMIVLALSLVTLATWRLTGRPALFRPITPGGARVFSRHLLPPVLVGEGVAGLGLILYAKAIGPLVAHDLVGAVLSGVLVGIVIECHRCDPQRSIAHTTPEPSRP